MTYTEFIENQIRKLQPRIEQLENNIKDKEAYLYAKHKRDMERISRAVEEWKNDGETEWEYMELELSDAIANEDEEDYFYLEKAREELKDLKETLRYFTDIKEIIRNWVQVEQLH